MAATTLTSNEQMNSIRSKAQQQAKKKNDKGSKPKLKHVMMPIPQKTMLKVEESKEKDIVDKLKQCLEKFSVPKKIPKQKDAERECILEKKKQLRSQVVFGVNDVTKSLEKDLLRLVLSCSSVDPLLLTKHIVELAATRNCAAICVNNLNEILMNTINFRSAAIGFLKATENMGNDFVDFFEFVSSAIPSLHQDERDKLSSVVLHTPDSNKETNNCLPEEKAKLLNTEQDKSMEITHENDDNDETKSEQESEPEDYSRFYVYKKDLPASSFVPDFLPFVSDSDAQEESEEEVHVKTKKARILKDLEEYQSVSVGKMKQNENKKKKKKNKMKIKNS